MLCYTDKRYQGAEVDLFQKTCKIKNLPLRIIIEKPDYYNQVDRIRDMNVKVQLWNLGFVKAYQNSIFRGQGLSI